MQPDQEDKLIKENLEQMRTGKVVDFSPKILLYE